MRSGYQLVNSRLPVRWSEVMCCVTDLDEARVFGAIRPNPMLHLAPFQSTHFSLRLNTTEAFDRKISHYTRQFPTFVVMGFFDAPKCGQQTIVRNHQSPIFHDMHQTSRRAVNAYLWCVTCSLLGSGCERFGPK